MTKRIKVWGGRYLWRRDHARAIVAATSQKEVARIVGTSLHEIRHFWSETGNETELHIATGEPGTLFIERNRWKGDYVPLDKLRSADT